MRAFVLVLLFLVPVAAAADVTLEDNRFVPDRIEVAPGEIIHLVNRGESPHTFTADDRALFHETNIAPGSTRNVTAPSETGEYPFQCVYHPGEMEGILVVRAPTEPTAGPTDEPPTTTPLDPTPDDTPATTTPTRVPAPGFLLVALAVGLAVFARKA